jgi:hypothetical protein
MNAKITQVDVSAYTIPQIFRSRWHIRVGFNDDRHWESRRRTNGTGFYLATFPPARSSIINYRS